MIKIKSRHLMKLSMIIDKMGIKDQLMNLEKGTNEELAKALIVLISTNLYKAEEEIYQFISTYYGISKEEAEEVDIIEFVKGMVDVEAIKNFLSQA